MTPLAALQNCARGTSHRPVQAEATGSREQVETEYAGYRRHFPAVRDITPEEVGALSHGLVVLVDVRTIEEQRVSRIPDSITAEQLEANSAEFRQHIIIPYCTIGYRSGLFAKQLGERGFDARNLQAGILAWCHADLPLVDDNGPTHRVHVYGPTWDLLPAGYAATWQA